ncbi:MAG: hypothetical protein JWR26_45 [Pedosphaera sp.]|nr:hypothetical protein [Pedosphaera sp.]
MNREGWTVFVPVPRWSISINAIRSGKRLPVFRHARPFMCPFPFGPSKNGASSWAMCPAPRRSWIASCTMPRPSPSPVGATGSKIRPQWPGKNRSTAKPSQTNLWPQNRRAEWLAIRFCSFYFAAQGLWKSLDFDRESAILTAWCAYRDHLFQNFFLFDLFR